MVGSERHPFHGKFLYSRVFPFSRLKWHLCSSSAYIYNAIKQRNHKWTQPGLGVGRNWLFFVKAGAGVVALKILGVGVVKKFFVKKKITNLDFYVKLTLKNLTFIQQFFEWNIHVIY